MTAPTANTPYHFDPDFEAAVTWKCVTSPSFYGRVGHFLDPELVAAKPAKLLLRAARIVFTKTGSGPASPTIALQRLSELCADGKLSYTDRDEVRAWVEEYRKNPDAVAIPDDALQQELVPILQKRMKHQAAMEMFQRVGKGGDTSQVVSMLTKADAIGMNDASLGIKLGKASFEQVRVMRGLTRLETGIQDLDYEIRGLPLGQLGFFIGGPGDGKSMALIHVAGAALRVGKLVAYATLELDEAIVLTRLVANLTGISIDAVAGPAEEKAERMVEEAQAKGLIGHFVVKYFTPQATTVDDIREWVEAIKQEYGEYPGLLVIDYADKMSAPQAKSEYLAMRDVYEGLRLYGKALKMPIWTASQAKAKGKDHKQLGLYSAADSLHKARVGDLVVTLNVSEDRKTIMIHVPKHRTGEAGQTIGPLPTAFAVGRLVAVTAPSVDYVAVRRAASGAGALAGPKVEMGDYDLPT